MRLTTPAIVCALRNHGEHGAVVRLLTPEHGLQAAYVRGARGRRMRPVLIAGNQVQVALTSRTESQLPQAAIELVHSRGPLMQEPLPATAIEWTAALTATALPEGQPYPRLYLALDGLLQAIEAAPSAIGWGAALVRYELLLLAELGFGLEAERSPAFVRDGGAAGWAEIVEGLDLSGRMLERDILTDRAAAVVAARSRLVDRLRRAGN